MLMPRLDISGWTTRITDGDIARYAASGYWSGETIHEKLWERAAEKPDAVAIHLEHAPPVTFGQIAEDAIAVARALSAQGLVPGDVISFQLPNWHEAAAINAAASALGLVVNPIVPIYRGAECLHILQDARTKLLFIPETIRGFDYRGMIDGLRPLLPDLRAVVVVRPVHDSWEQSGAIPYDAFIAAGKDQPVEWPKVDPNAVKLVLYTSGTTGRAKAVLHTHNTLAASRMAGVRYWRVGPGDVMFMPSPVTHITGYSLALELPILEDIQAALMLRWEAGAAVDYIDRVGATLTVGATPFLQELIAEVERRGQRLPSLRMFACGGAAVPPDLIRAGNRVFAHCRCHRMYGSTEAPAITRGWMGEGEEERAAVTDGKIMGWEVLVLDADGVPLPNGQDGEIAARGPALTVGYGDPAQTAESFTEDGYFLTGDLGHITPDGAILITGRKKDLIIRGGENLSAKEIEDVLHRHPGIREAAIVSMPHARLGESVCAYVIAADAAAPPGFAEITAFIAAAGLARQKFPERIEIIDDFPRTPSGKIRKDVLRTMIRELLTLEAQGERP
jgi:acyl-CoA synthetase (AMP-forming)/AMP-acid ligase II